MLSWIEGNYIEIFGAVTGIAFVFLEIKQNIWLWPLGIVTSAVYIYVFFHSRFYADMGLQWYYLVVSIYGWYWWKKGMNVKSDEEDKYGNKKKIKSDLQVSRLSIRKGLSLAAISLILFLVIRFVLVNFTDSPIPGWDAFTTAISVVATWMLARKILEHWILWIIADLVSIVLYIYKGLYPTVVLFAVYTIMAIIGYREWTKTARGLIEKNNGSL